MPRRKDIKKVMLIGSGPIIIGQASEFDYSGTQSCKALKAEGIEVVLVNSNPATIMTDPEFADKTYIEPINPDILEKIIKIEMPDALLPTMGGQTALNMAVALSDSGVLKRYGVELIGARLDTIKKAEDRELFKASMLKIGLDVPFSKYTHSKEEAMKFVREIGFPVIIRPSFTLGGTGASVAYNIEEFENKVEYGLNISPSHEVLLEESVLGWKEFELEMMRDKNDNCIVVCSIENLDPMGIHTGDSITVAPAQTLTDKEYQNMRDAAIKIMREIGIESGGSNIQFAVNPVNGEMVVIEMNPRVSRSSALASKATGYPIAKVATKLAIGYTLDEITNDITKNTKASFEPTIDYVVTKIPKFAFEKFPQADDTLTTQMKSVGEVMAIGRTFKESFQKAIRSLESGVYGLVQRIKDEDLYTDKAKEKVINELKRPSPDRIFYIGDALRMGFTVDEIHRYTSIDPWFLNNIKEIIEFEKRIKSLKGYALSTDEAKGIIIYAKKMGFSDRYMAELLGVTESIIGKIRTDDDLKPVYKVVDTCGAEFEAYTPYLYSTYEQENESSVSGRKKVVILGSGPNRIGQGIEFDYCCVHASFALREEGYESIMINSNPETVSTDYDTSDKLYFEPVTYEDVMNVIEQEKPDGVIVQFGGQTPLKLAKRLEAAGVRVLGTSPESIDIAEDRKRFRELLEQLGLKQPTSLTATSVEEAIRIGNTIGFPLILRPSYVLGGRAMEIVYDNESLVEYMTKAVNVSEDKPVLVDKFLENATEIDVDAISDGDTVVIGGIMEHIEEAGIHSGDSACSLPPFSLSRDLINEIERQTKLLARALEVVGLINIQYAVKDNEIYIIEANPRASRTIPFVSKSIGVPLAKLATKLMVGKKLKDVGFTKEVWTDYITVKEAVLPFMKLPGVDTILGPEMKSTGEVMGIDKTFALAFAKSQIASNTVLPLSGNVFISVKDSDKMLIVPIAKKLKELGFNIIATRGTAQVLKASGIDVKVVNKVQEGRPHIVDLIKNGEIALLINTTFGKKSINDSYSIRRSAIVYNVPYYTTIEGAEAAYKAIVALKNGNISVTPLQQLYKSYIS
ncbi:MAG: carbamoyl-phosphate synthase large subunit [bacterium]